VGEDVGAHARDLGVLTGGTLVKETLYGALDGLHALLEHGPGDVADLELMPDVKDLGLLLAKGTLIDKR